MDYNTHIDCIGVDRLEDTGIGVDLAFEEAWRCGGRGQLQGHWLNAKVGWRRHGADVLPEKIYIQWNHRRGADVLPLKMNIQ